MMSMNRTCKNCDSAVSNNFARVYGDNEDNVHLCMNCVEGEGGGRELLRNGAAAMGVEAATSKTY